MQKNVDHLIRKLYVKIMRYFIKKTLFLVIIRKKLI